MANRSPVPKFGDWNPDVPLTVVFDKVSRSKKHQPPNDEYPEMNPNASQNRDSRHDHQPPNHNVKPMHERVSSREKNEVRPSHAHNDRNKRVRAHPPSETYNHKSYSGGGRSVGNPSEINRQYPQEPVSAQPKPIPNLRNRSKERGPTIPPFPISDSDHQSYTLIFDRVKDERKQSERSDNGSSDRTPTQPMNDQHHKPLPSSPKVCCFPWSRK